MNDRPASGGAPLGRWLVVAALILLGLALYLRYAPDSRPAASPAIQEEP